MTTGTRLCLLAATLAASACGGSTSGPAAPDAPGAFITPGAYVIGVTAPDATVVNGKVVSGCPGAGPANLGIVQANAVVSTSGSEAHARPASAADGTFDLRITWNGSETSTGMRGVVVNTMMPPAGPIYDARASFEAPSEVPLVITSKTPIVAGSVFGSVTMTNGSGAAVTCSPGTATWTLSKVLR
jgi:hypothetical protein